MSIRDQMLARSRRRIKEVRTIPGVDVVWIQSLSEKERSDCEFASINDPSSFRAKLISYAFVDEDGDRIFGDSDLETIKELDSSFTGVLLREIEIHCGVDHEPVEETVKN